MYLIYRCMSILEKKRPFKNMYTKESHLRGGGIMVKALDSKTGSKFEIDTIGKTDRQIDN